ncbi:uncharacterized protein [Antedon mediterranea]|uniref:uncharacterized protein isoform X2 n=1 Tax=Antedon mediterranea TaxID=105859 RepID=UPI003AF68B00
MAFDGYYDFYITSDDYDWETRILRKLEAKGLRGYHRNTFTLGSLKSSSRLNGIKNSKVTIIGFVPLSKTKSSVDKYLASLSFEFKGELICVQITEDSVIPDEYAGLVHYHGSDEEGLCCRIEEVIKSLPSGGDNFSMETGDVVDSSRPQPLDFGPLTDLRIAELARELGNDWSMLATYLGISLAQQQDLRRDHQICSRERNQEMLVLWRKRDSCSPSEKLRTLMTALEKSDRTDLKDIVSLWQ